VREYGGKNDKKKNDSDTRHFFKGPSLLRKKSEARLQEGGSKRRKEEGRGKTLLEGRLVTNTGANRRGETFIYQQGIICREGP